MALSPREQAVVDQIAAANLDADEFGNVIGTLVAQRVQRALREALGDPDVQRALREAFSEALGGDPDA
jgi:uncharacterized protein YjgD (DUF1641 family)